MTKTRVALFAGQDLGYVMADYFSRRSDIDLFVASFQSRRDIINGYRSALTVCQEKRIPFIETTRPYLDTHETLKRWKPDIIVCAYYARLFPPELLKIPRLGAINAHPGKFPRYQGPMPTPWYILNGETTFGMGIFRIDEGIDTGPVFVQREYPIPDDETGHGLLRRTMQAAADLYMESFDPILRGELVATPQVGEPLFCPRIEPQYRIDWALPAEMIRRWIRVHAKPYFPAYTFIYNRMVAINGARVHGSEGSAPRAPGELVDVLDDHRFIVSCGNGLLLVEDYELYPPPSGNDEWQQYFQVGTRLR
jgi:methionyl-tRNA formyltransferase